MRIKKVLSFMLAAAMVCTTMLSGCGSEGNTDTTTETETKTEAEAEKKEETTASENDVKKAAVQELNITNNSDPLTWDPTLANTQPDHQAQALVYEGLTKKIADKDGVMQVVPGTAESWDVSEDGTVYTFHLRENLKWADGSPLTAEDYVFAWKRLFTPETAAPQAWLVYEMVKGAEDAFMGKASVDDVGVKAVDDRTFEVTLNKPNKNFLYVTDMNCTKAVKKELIDKFGAQYGANIENIVGNGPFNVVAWDVGAQIIYEKNPNYWDAENVSLTKVTVRMIQEVSTLAQSLINNELDIAGLNNPDWNDLVDETGYYNVVECPEMNIEDLMFNCEKKPFNNWKVRLAMSLAFDREAYNNEVCNGNVISLQGFTPPICDINGKPYADLVDNKNQVYKTLAEKYPDPKALLIEGLKEEGMNDPSEVTVELYTRGTGENSKKSAEWIKQCFETKLGINLSINMTEWNVMYDLVESGDFELANMGWGADLTGPNEFMDLYDSVDGYYGPRHRWTGPEADKYHELVQAYKAIDNENEQEKADAYLAAEEYLCEYGPTIPTYSSKQRKLVGTYVHEFYPNAQITPDYAHVWLSER